MTREAFMLSGSKNSRRRPLAAATRIQCSGNGHEPMPWFGDYHLEARSRRLFRQGREVSLSPKALDVLYYLVERPGQLLSREELFEALWPGVFVDDHALSVQIREIRRALEDDPKQPRFIETRHRRGYVFIAEVREDPPVVRTGESAAPFDFPPPEIHYARSGEVNIAYQVVGHGPLDLVFVMGWVSHLEYFWKESSFARFLLRLASMARLILFDKRGTGLSDRVPIAQLPSLEQRMDDVRAVMDAAGSRRAVLCGVSEGGPMSMLFAATHPEKTLGLIMIGTYARRLRDDDYPWGPTPEQRERYLQEIESHWGGPIGIEERAPSRANDPAFRQWWATYLRMGASPGAVVALTRMNAQIDVRPVLPSIRVPTLVIHRSGDQCLKVEEGRYVASRIPRARFVELPGDDHLPFVGDQEGILGPIQSFVSGLRQAQDRDRVLATVVVAEVSREPGVPAGAWERYMGRVRAEIEWFRGQEARVDPGGVVATFDGPARAVRCALALQSHAQTLALPFRAGLHTGECVNLGGPLLDGPAVQVARLIAREAGHEEILASSTLRDLVAGSGLRFQDRGPVALTNFEATFGLVRVEPGQGSL